MKLHRHLINETALALKTIFEEDRYADKVIERALKNHPKWGSRDRRFFAETVYDMVRYWRFLWFCLGRNVDETDKVFSDKDLKKIFGVYWYLHNDELPQFDEFKELNLEKINQQKELAQKRPEIRESYPDWIYNLITDELGDQTVPILQALNEKAEVVLRTNLLKTTRSKLKDALFNEQVETIELDDIYPDGLILTERKNVFITKAFKDGWFEMQDGSSQRVAHFMKLQPSLRVIDACAGAGGKTLHIASLMKNKGKVIALDVAEKKLEEMKKRLRRDGVDIVEARVIDSTKMIKRLEKTADRVLLDVPCSGLGVLRRNPDAKWKMTADRLKELKVLQQNILENYSVMTKVGGYLIYATCSLLPSENKKQVDWFLEKYPEHWALEEEVALFPHTDRFDGFYMARLKRLK